MTTFNVTQATDNGKGDTVGTLSYAILLANNSVGDDTINLASDVRMTGRMQELIESNINIVGNNHILSGDANGNGTLDTGDVRPIFVLSGTVGISDLTITNGLAQGESGGGAGMGGAMFIYDGAVSLNNVTLNNNKAIGGAGQEDDTFLGGVAGVGTGGQAYGIGIGNGANGNFGENGGNGYGAGGINGANGTGAVGGNCSDPQL
jgi:hypothetical protein